MATRVEYSLEVTVNIGNFENVKPGFKIITDVPDGEHPEVTKQRCEATVNQWMDEAVQEIRSVMGR